MRLLLFLITGFSLVANPNIYKGIRLSDRYDVQIVADFDSSTPWHVISETIVQSSVVLSNGRPFFTEPQNPEEEKLSALYSADLEAAVFYAQARNRSVKSDQKQSLEMRLFFSRPGREKLLVAPTSPWFTTGRVRACALWVRGNGRRDLLNLVVSAPGVTQRELPIARMDYEGWERFEVAIPPYLHRRNISREKRMEFTIHGLSIHSHPKEDPGLSLITVDFITCLVDRSEENLRGYPEPLF